MNHLVPMAQRARVQSLLDECAAHINAVLNIKVHLSVAMRMAMVDEEMIREMICDHYGIKFHEIRCQSRTRRIVNARMCYSYLLRKYLNMSFADIGRLIDRDHTSVIHQVNTITDYLSINDESIANTLNPIINYLNRINEPQEI